MGQELLAISAISGGEGPHAGLRRVDRTQSVPRGAGKVVRDNVCDIVSRAGRTAPKPGPFSSLPHPSLPFRVRDRSRNLDI